MDLEGTLIVLTRPQAYHDESQFLESLAFSSSTYFSKCFVLGQRNLMKIGS